MEQMKPNATCKKCRLILGPRELLLIVPTDGEANEIAAAHLMHKFTKTFIMPTLSLIVRRPKIKEQEAMCYLYLLLLPLYL